MSGTLLGLVMGGSVSTKAQAEFGSVRVVFIKAGPLVGAGRGRGVLTFQGRNYPFKISSFGATIGNSTSTMVGQVLNMRAPEDIEGTYNFFSTVGARVVQLQNAKGVLLELHGKASVELSAGVGGVEITMR